MSHSLYESVIGLEIHVQLKTKSKAFCFSAAETESKPNSHLGVVTAALPGALPVLNSEVVKLAAIASLALNCKISETAVFERKHYFYPDLPKGYQISQLAKPIGTEGFLEIEDTPLKKVKVNIDRIQIEEDAGKLMHLGSSSLVDLNRAGTALIEIVTKPDLRTPTQAAKFMKLVYDYLVFAKVCDGNLELGNFRCDANVSVRKPGQKEFGTRVEIKNLNSFRFLEKAIDYEIARQITVLDSGENVYQETRGWDSGTSTTFSMRKKEEAQDYRYFPDPDLPPLKLSKGWVAKIKQNMPMLPDQIEKKLLETYFVEPAFAKLIASDATVYDYFIKIVDTYSVLPSLCAKWICGDLAHELNVHDLTIHKIPFSKKSFSLLLSLVEHHKISAQNAKKILKKMFSEPLVDPEVYASENNLLQISDPSKINEWVCHVFDQNPKVVEDARQGDLKVLDYLSGQVMKLSQGKANPVLVSQVIKEKLKEN